MAYGLQLLTAPAAEPVTLAAMRAWLRVDADDTTQDQDIADLITAAREWGEEHTGRAFLTQTWLLTVDRFPSLFWIGSWGNAYQDYQGYQGPSQGAGQGNWQWTLDGKTIRLPKPPLQSVASIQYLDTAGVLQTLDPALYQIETGKVPGLLAPAYGLAWPVARAQYGSVRITFTAGYGAAAAVPQRLVRAVKQLVSWWYEHRDQGDVPEGIRNLFDSAWTGEVA